MNQSKTKLTNRKFYNKWLYKISLHVSGGGLFRIHSIEDIKLFCYGSSDGSNRPYTPYYKAFNNKKTILKLCCFLEKFDKDIWTKRIEKTTIDFYTNDLDFYDSMSEEFEDILIHRFEPHPENIDVLNDNEYFISTKKLPHKIYNYRVYLLPHKLAHEEELKEKYVDWLEGQSPKIRCSEKVKDWFIRTNWNWDRRYILVDDEKTLLMLKLRNSEVVGRIYKYVICDK